MAPFLSFVPKNLYFCTIESSSAKIWNKKYSTH